MNIPTPTEVQAAAEKYALGRDPLPTLDAELGRKPAEHTAFTLAEARAFRNGAQFILDALRAPQVGDEELATQYVRKTGFFENDVISPMDIGLAFVDGIRHARAQSAAEISELKLRIQTLESMNGKC